MSTPRWSLEALARYADHPDYAVRRWALAKLASAWPVQGASLALRWLRDPKKLTAVYAVEMIGRSGVTSLGPEVLAAWPEMVSDEVRDSACLVLSKFGVRQALPLMRSALFDEGMDTNLRVAMLEAVGALGGEVDHLPLRVLVLDEERNFFVRYGAMRSLLALHRVADVAWFLRELQEASGDGSDRMASTLTGALDLEQVRGFFRTFERAGTRPKPPIPTVCDWMERERLPLSDGCLAALAEHRAGSAGWFTALHQEARMLVEARGDDIEGWARQTASRPHVQGYRWWAPATLAFLEKGPLFRRSRELGLVALLATAVLALDRDDEATLASASNREEALLALITDPRDRVLPSVLDEVVALGPRVVNRLCQALMDAPRPGPRRRIILVLVRLTCLHPEACGAAAPALAQIEADVEGRLDSLIAGGLSALGPAAIPALREAAAAGKGEIYTIARALAGMDAPEAAELLDLLDQEGRLNRLSRVKDLGATGDARFVERLAQAWAPGEWEVSEKLVALAVLNDLDDPRAPLWWAHQRSEPFE